MKTFSRLAAFALLVPALVLGACDDSPTDEDDEPEIATLALTLGGQLVTINEGGGVTSGQLRIAIGSTPVSVQALTATGAVINLGNEFQLDVIPDASGRITFTRTGDYTGTLTANSAGTAVVKIGLLHKDDDHYDFGLHSHTFTVVNLQ